MLCALLVLCLSAAHVQLSAHSQLYAHPPLYALRSELSEDDILVANNRIHVPLGRAVFVDPVNDLVIQAQSGDRCSVTVLDNDPLAQRLGRLSPKKFPCVFGPNDVTYTHYGSRSPAQDRVRLQLRYDSHAETVVIPFVMEVEVVFTQLELLTKNMPLTVTHLRGTSDAIDHKILDFTYDWEMYKCGVMSLAGRSALPRYGRLLDGGKLSQTMDCDELTQANIRYDHTFQGVSPNRDHIPMVVELRDREGNLVKQEHFHLMVRIRVGQENTAPRPSFVAMMMMEVSQFVMTAFTPEMLASDDAESDPGELVFNVTSPLSYEEGYIVSTDDQNLPITSFYQRDLQDLKITYKPPSLDADTERIFQLEFEVVDPEGAVSDPFAFMIVVKPMNSLAPVVTQNAGQLLYEGQSRPLVTGHNLEISDEDNLEAVSITVVGGLRHGLLLVLGSHGKSFTAADLAAGTVVYQHDGSDTHSDNIVFKMTDGKHHVEFLFPVTVVPTDDEPPIINANTGLGLFKYQMMPVSPLALSAADIDSEDSTVKFTMVPPFSALGVMLLRQSDAPEDPSSWKFNTEDEVYEKEVYEWLQKDITDGKLFYKHVGPHNIDTIMDQFVFTVQDDNDPPNESDQATFVIRVLPIDDVPPELHPGTALQMTVEEYKLTQVSEEVLRYTDLDSEDRDLKYTLLQPPTNTDENHQLVFGSLVLTDNPDVEVTEFTQAQVNHRKIAYSPPDKELGITTHVLQFRYSVEDAARNSVEGVFTIYLQPINNKPPQITNTGFAVFEGGVHILTLAELDAVDADTESQTITFRLSQPPKHGTIQVAFANLPEKAVFSLQDLSEGRISYSHGGEETASDEFQLDVSDCVHVVTVTVKVHVKLIDDEAPTLSLPAGTVGSRMDVLENGAAEITANVIQGRDDDTDDLQLTFILEDPPTMGEILVKGLPASRFTQTDVINGVVVYAHTGGEIGLTSHQDGFNLTLTDMSDDWTVGGNRVHGVHVRVTVLPVDSEAPEVGVGLQFSVLEGDKNAIGPQHLNVDDIDTPVEDILCTIIVQPNAGYVQNISPAPGSEKSRSGTAVSAFTVGDVRAGNIFYVQSIYKGVEPVEDQFTFTCSDGINFSEKLFFPIVIVPTNDELPEIFLREIMVMEGMNVVLDTPVVNGHDADVPAQELMFIISRPPKHGVIVNQLPTGSILGSNFTLEAIREASSIVYKHDDSETTEDSFELLLTDGKFSVWKSAAVTIIAVDDETPRMQINNGLEVEVGETKDVDSKVLKATDLDSDDNSLAYIIRFGPSQGLLQRRTPLGSTENITLGSNFTQTEVNARHVFYTHNGQEGIRDLIKFDVTDGINLLIDRYFYISVGGIDVVFPDVVSKGVSLKEGDRVTLTTDLLSTTDLNSPDENLVFTITRAPVRGHLECTDTPGVSVVSFTQLQLAGSKIYYIHTADDELKMDSFEFEVTDGYNPIFRTFRVSILDVDNKKPVVTINSLRVTEGHSKIITPFELTAEDQDTVEKLLKFTVTQLPVHGKLLFNKSKPVSMFTKQDLNKNIISYAHDGTESLEDSFSFTVTDGTHSDFYVFPDTVFETRRPQTLKIIVVPVDNSVPQMAVNKGASTLKTLPTGQLGHLVGPKRLRAEDRESGPAALVFRVTTPPRHGYLVNMGRGNDSVDSFSQADIDDLNVWYFLRKEENTTSDVFHFSVEDNGGNKLPGQEFRLDWCWISVEKEYYVVDEGDREEDGEVFLEVVLRRRGYLGETSFVGIDTQDGSAKKDQDFRGKSQRQVQFNPGQTRASWWVRILTDGKYERAETFQILLSEPVMAALEFPAVATVEIVDPNDESSVFFPEALLSVEEDVGRLSIPVHRSGDISEELMVLCYTQQGSATGTVPTTVLSYSDYISRPEEHGGVLRFDKGEREKACRVVVIDDSLYEPPESFNVTLSVPVGGRLGLHYPSARVTILEDQDDAPMFYFGEEDRHVDESDGFVEVKVFRTGSDLSKSGTVTVRSRKSEPVSAEAGVDYVGISRNLDFAPGVSALTFRVNILDDLGRPELEGPETFDLVLRMPVNGILGEPGKVTVAIDDSLSDLPKVQFHEAVHSGEEHQGQLVVMVYRSGDLRFSSTVRCSTRQGSAQVASDFDERPNTDASVIAFSPGETEKPCVLSLVDDSLYEEVEALRLVLGSPKSDSQFGAALGDLKETSVKIKDTADKPIVRFSETKFSASEPKVVGGVASVRIPVVRLGDTSKVSVVRVHTKDGSAVSGEDYHPVSQDIVFKQGDKEHVVHVEILYDGAAETREAFTLHLKPDDNMVAETQNAKATVYVEEANSMADVTFPSLPHVLSLLHYDHQAAATGGSHPPAGYPVICVTACNTRYPDYDKTGSICVSEHINDTLTRYRWLVSAPASPDGVTGPMRELDFDTFFTSSKAVTLDSIYFQAGSRVQCAARAVNSDGDEGLELSSPVVTVSHEGGMCQPRKMGTVGAEPFSAKLRYTGTDDPKHPNLIKVTVTMPHVDGMLPIISTRPLNNLELTLSPDGTRVGNRRCSNLPDCDEVSTAHGFPKADTHGPESAGHSAPYQFSSALRGNATLRFYRNLNLAACLWEFSSYYRMSELLTDCGGTIGTDGQVLNLVQSYVTLRVPLYVSYVFHSPVGAGGWQHFDLRSELRLTFVYDTAILWTEGIGSPPQAELQGSLHPISMRIDPHGRLLVNFRTKARFRGLFVQSHATGRIPGSPVLSGTSEQSTVMSATHPALTFNLSLVRSEPTFNQPMQQWTFTSDFAVRDYSGTYTVNLVPCTASQNTEYSVPPVCSPSEPVAFDVDIRFQQVSDPVAVEFSLNTQMFLLSKRSLWLSDGSVDISQESAVAFLEGDIVYGRVMVDPVQNLGDSFFCSIEKVFLCTGADGYVPKYSPTNFEFGCLADSPSLLYRFKIIDKEQPETQARVFGDVDFNAMLAMDDPSAAPLVRQPGSDGFKMDSRAMFQVASGREWYIHTIYTVRSRESANKGIGKRGLESHRRRRRHAFTSTGGTRSASAADLGPDANRGTNIMHVALDRVKRPAAAGSAHRPSSAQAGELIGGRGDEGAVTVAGALVGVLLMALMGGVLTLAVRYRRKDGERELEWREGVREAVKGSLSSEPILVVRMQHCRNSSDV
ncbi:FRAS1-related extracellular matrix protein 2-like [Phyllopteryx taeniolatus]|uniref:FRAS1-related extracellular matrix protein 2-like n=1 Tax=Phyllopteryx taeniolatus TaxID=161469 RepID=UPI002AD27A0D|nr:FRAS1-related extracellular matrix protein 2-like [Phyllopteryx taeniolatus]